MLVCFSAGGLSGLLAAHTPSMVGFVGRDPFDRSMPGETERLGLAPPAGRAPRRCCCARRPRAATPKPWPPSGQLAASGMARRADRGRFALRLRVAH